MRKNTIFFVKFFFMDLSSVQAIAAASKEECRIFYEYYRM